VVVTKRGGFVWQLLTIESQSKVSWEPVTDNIKGNWSIGQIGLVVFFSFKIVQKLAKSKMALATRRMRIAGAQQRMIVNFSFSKFL